MLIAITLIGLLTVINSLALALFFLGLSSPGKSIGIETTAQLARQRSAELNKPKRGE